MDYQKPEDSQEKPVVSKPKTVSATKLEATVKKHFPRSSELKDKLKQRGITSENCTAQLLRRAFSPLVAEAVQNIMKELEEGRDAE